MLIKILPQALQKDKEHKCFEYYRERAIAKTKLKDYQSAIDDYTKAMSLLYLDDDELFLQRGILKTKIFDFNGALEDYRAAIETGKFHFYEFHLGGILKELDEYKTESKGKFWRKTAIETKQVNQLINKIKKGVKDDKCFELNEIIQDKTFKVLLQDLKENFELSSMKNCHQ